MTLALSRVRTIVIKHREAKVFSNVKTRSMQSLIVEGIQKGLYNPFPHLEGEKAFLLAVYVIIYGLSVLIQKQVFAKFKRDARICKIHMRRQLTPTPPLMYIVA